MTTLEFIGAIFLIIIATLLFGQFGLRYIYSYKIMTNRVQIVLFGILPIRWINFLNVKEMRILADKTIKLFNFYHLTIASEDIGPFGAERWGNRIFGGTVLIVKKKGLSRKMLITPDNPEEFIRNVKKIKASRFE